MTGRAIAATAREPRAERYARTEAALWARYGLLPSVRSVQLASPPVRLRILEFGSGKPLLFVHGTVGPGGWASLIGAMPGVRCLVLDRPGWGGSDPVDFPGAQYRLFVADMLRVVLDALAIERIDVVGGSIGDVWALSLAEHHPSRVDRLVLLGGGPVVPEVRVPRVIRALASPIGGLMVRLPMSEKRLRSIFRENGHGASLSDGRVADEFLEWRLSVANDTASMRHERDMVHRIVRGSGWRPGLTFDDGQLARIAHPTMLVYGTADPTGSVDTWRRVTGLLPNGELQLLDGAGHHPWFEDAPGVAARVMGFLAPRPTHRSASADAAAALPSA